MLRYLWTRFFNRKYRKYIKDCLEVSYWLDNDNKQIYDETGRAGHVPFGLLYVNIEQRGGIEFFDTSIILSSKSPNDLRYRSRPAAIKVDGMNCPVIYAPIGFGYEFYKQSIYLKTKGFNILNLLLKEKLRRS